MNFPIDAINKRAYARKDAAKSLTSYRLQTTEIIILVKYRDSFWDKRVLDVGCGAGRTTLFLKNFQTGEFEQVGQFTNGLENDTVNTITVADAGRFVRPNGRIVLRIKKIVILPFTLGGFHSLIDQVEIVVR